MYFPKSNDEMHKILMDLRHYAELEAMPELSESLSDAIVYLEMEKRGLLREIAITAEADPAP